MTKLILPILILTLGLSGCARRSSEAAAMTKKAPEPIEVRVANAEARTVERSIGVTGSIVPDETTTVSSEVPGRVVRMNVDFGQNVRKGQVLAELDTQELSLQLERAKGTLAQALARVGLDAKQEEVTPETTPMMRQAWNQMEDARQKYENAKKLVASGDIAPERFNELDKAFRAREAAFEATRDELRTQLAAIRSLRADVKLAEKRLRDATVVAPFDGAVSQKMVSPGQYIKENVPLFTVVKSYPLRLRVEVPESGVPTVKAGTTLTFTSDAAPGREFHAVVKELNPSLDARSRTLSVEARLVDRDPALRPGIFVQVKLVTAKAFPVVAVPRAAVYTVAGLNKLFTIENGQAVEHKIEEILAANGWVEMPPSTLPAGAQVAVTNVPLLTTGTQVTVRGGKS